MSDYRVEIKVRNNNFLRKLEECGYATIGEFCRRNGMMNWASTLGEFANLKKSPLDRYGKFLNIVEQICDILQCLPEDLFSEEQLTTALESNKRAILVNKAEMKFMLENQCELLALEDQTDLTNLPEKVGELLETLTPREAKVIAMHFGLRGYSAHSLVEVARSLDVTAERIRQIEAKALRKLRHPSRRKIVRDYLTKTGETKYD
jgi:DNA-binding CsgD family transcriptional regulator